MRVGEMLDAAINIYRMHWKALMGIVAFVLVPFYFLEELLIRVTTHPFQLNGRAVTPTSEQGTLVAITLIFTLASYLLVRPFLTGAIVRAAVGIYEGEQPTVQGIYRYAAARLGSVLLVVVLSTLAIMGGFILLVIPAFIFYVRFLFSVSVVVVEDERGTEAMRRSWRLAKGSFWKIFGTVLLAGILAGVVNAIIALPTSIGAIFTSSWGWLLRFVGASIAGIVTTPFLSMIPVLLYFDMRVRKEGFDLEVMARELQAHPGAE